VPKSVSVADVKAHCADCVPAGELELLQRLRDAGPEKGLASLAGGWEGSEDLAEQTGEIRRSGPRNLPDLE